MSVIKILIAAGAKGTRLSALLLSLLTLTWRLADLTEEAIAWNPQMSMGTWRIAGCDAAVLQIIIVGVLIAIFYRLQLRAARFNS